MSAVGEHKRGVNARDELPAHSWATHVGPGLVSTATDNDPSGVVTYSLAGAQFGYDMLWMCALSYPSMVAFQLVAARIAAQTGKGLTLNMREHYSRLLFYLAVTRFLVANILNIAADVVAMGVGAQFLWHGSVPLFATVFGMLSIALQWFVPYARYARILKWLAACLFAYVGVTLISHPSWTTLALHAVVPRITWSVDYFTMLLAVLGTTISPYLLFAQAEQQIEEHSPQAGVADRAGSDRQLKKLRGDTLIRTILSNAIGLFIMAAAALTLHVSGHGLVDVQDAASVLRPLAGGYATHVLGLAFIGTGLLALPPLAGSAANAAVSARDRRAGRQRNRPVARALLVVMALGVLIGVALTLVPIEPVRVLYWSAVLNGSTATPVMVMLVLLSMKRSAVGDLSAHWTLRALCWLATVFAGAALVAEFACKWLG
ncbi:Mn2+/Fe2+ NRAMP family transporter [Paraburkholderia sp. BL6665CI2N2]|uniref:NRAMP family divalent metal transporter n=1 Tax=Paraburkholderia sp. BL6665CI2N2 TaxID=1938806 RepID=UPI001065D6EA|nr:divalent metal cation transporter [Paraburkholderia sp. BL6665CI2N2]TDY20799.1 Mn2+/Fe2+ NRAMP family transporter [Paraburkholderia sp. BL6665CI2N2]